MVTHLAVLLMQLHATPGPCFYAEQGDHVRLSCYTPGGIWSRTRDRPRKGGQLASHFLTGGPACRRPCCPRCGPNGRCRVPGTSDVIRVCNRAVAADGSSGGAAAFVDGVPANDAASGTDEALSYYTDEEEYGEDAI